MGTERTDEALLGKMGVRVRASREKAGLSQGELSRRIGFHKTAIAHIEAGRKGPSLSKLVALATALDVTTDYLLGGG